MQIVLAAHNAIPRAARAVDALAAGSPRDAHQRGDRQRGVPRVADQQRADLPRLDLKPADRHRVDLQPGDRERIGKVPRKKGNRPDVANAVPSPRPARPKAHAPSAPADPASHARQASPADRENLEGLDLGTSGNCHRFDELRHRIVPGVRSLSRWIPLLNSPWRCE